MKRLAVLAVVVLFTACGSKSEEAPAETAPAAAAESVTTPDSAQTDSTVATDSAAKPM